MGSRRGEGNSDTGGGDNGRKARGRGVDQGGRRSMRKQGARPDVPQSLLLAPTHRRHDTARASSCGPASAGAHLGPRLRRALRPCVVAR